MLEALRIGEMNYNSYKLTYINNKTSCLEVADNFVAYFCLRVENLKLEALDAKQKEKIRKFTKADSKDKIRWKIERLLFEC